MQIADRIKTQDELAEIIKQAKSEGKVVVSTNGVFDFIHPGHMEYMEKAAALGDIMVIALNSDASVRRIKGPTRPINNEQDRAFILAGLRCIDYVCVFDEDSSETVLDKLKPSIHTKGGDYIPESMPETKIIRANGGEVVIISIKDGYSNSKQFDKIKNLKEDNLERAPHIA